MLDSYRELIGAKREETRQHIEDSSRRQDANMAAVLGNIARLKSESWRKTSRTPRKAKGTVSGAPVPGVDDPYRNYFLVMSLEFFLLSTIAS